VALKRKVLGNLLNGAGHQHRANDEAAFRLLTRLEELLRFCETPSVLETLDQWIRAGASVIEAMENADAAVR